MKSKISYILSFFLLLCFAGQLIITSVSCLYSDETTEETTELSKEDDLDEEIDLYKKICSSEWYTPDLSALELQNTMYNSSLDILGNYLHVDRSIPVPPPEKMV